MANLCVLATLGDGEPEARTLVLRDIATTSPADSALGVFVNGTSPKLRQLRQSDTAAVVVYLPSLSVQYRLRCRLEPMPADAVRESWQLRPSIPKRMDWLYERYPQSCAIDSRQRLTELLAGPDPDAAPATAIGFRLAVNSLERLDLDQSDGIHDRRRYTRDGGGWTEETLVP